MFQKTISFLLAYLIHLIFALGVGFFLWYFKPEETVSMQLYFWSVFPLALLALLLVEKVAQNSGVEKNVFLPRLKAISEDKYIFEPSALFSSQSMVSLYFSDEYERLVAVGYVETVISTKKTLQVVILHFANDYNRRKVERDIKKIILKPTIPYTNTVSYTVTSEGKQNDA